MTAVRVDIVVSGCIPWRISASLVQHSFNRLFINYHTQIAYFNPNPIPFILTFKQTS